MPEIIDDLEITALTHGGRGIGRHNGKAVFVPMVAPQDRVVCRVVRDKKSFAEAELVEVKSPSKMRRQAPCPYFGDCGGCQWQYLPYEQQLRWKEQNFKDLLVRQEVADAEAVLPIIPSPDEWHYRNRVQFKCSLTHSGLAVGFFRHGSHSVVDVASCMLLSPTIQSVYQSLRKELPDCPSPEVVSQVDVAVGDDESARVVLHVLPEAREDMRSWLEGFSVRNQINSCLQSGRKDTLEIVYGDPSLAVVVEEQELEMNYGPGGFAQVNPGQNLRMISVMLDWLELNGSERVLDLFCGMGNFSLPIARHCQSVIGVENYAPSIESARSNARKNTLANAEFHVGDAASFVRRFRPGDIDVVVLDPPRSGHFKAAKDLLTLQPDKILYISCDPATLARDLKPLVRGGYKVISSRPFDLFPQTWHIESMTLLVKSEV